MRLSTSLPTDHRGVPDAAKARHLEQLGYDAAGMPDVIIGNGAPGADPALVLAAAAAVTERIGLEFGVLTLPLRPVAQVAAMVQTLQHLSDGRVVLGVGIGGFPGSPYWQAVGAPVTGRGGHADAALRVLPGLIAGEPTRVGETEVTLAPAAAVPPILVGGNSEAAMRRAIRYGDGWAPSLISPAGLAAKVARLRELADELGRPAPSVSVGGHAILSGDRAALDAFLSALTGMHGMSEEEAREIPVTGGVEQVAERLAAYAEAGADAVGLGLDGAGWMEQAETLALAHARLAG
ncbi:LLM class flavin-dependent oxidoreductase [Nonomuraea candida]|uniref:LLM class flavin-dependent oxidoreductase n=1 Tax=Nonomuraea candida TaxID=359159 RepID=UPI0005BD1231|nr:LLM class flavin-dependent oxidoreductase [Nonomuraea candida]